MIVLDASVLIAYLDTADAHHVTARAIIVDTVNSGLALSVLTLAEVLVDPARSGRLKSVLSIVSDLAIETLALPEDAPVRLAELRARTQLRMPDCCVLLAAMGAGATVATFDHRLTRAAAEVGLPVRAS